MFSRNNDDPTNTMENYAHFTLNVPPLPPPTSCKYISASKNHFSAHPHLPTEFYSSKSIRLSFSSSTPLSHTLSPLQAINIPRRNSILAPLFHSAFQNRIYHSLDYVVTSHGKDSVKAGGYPARTIPEILLVSLKVQTTRRCSLKFLCRQSAIIVRPVDKKEQSREEGPTFFCFPNSLNKGCYSCRYVHQITTVSKSLAATIHQN